jgi:hypothetical protein
MSHNIDSTKSSKSCLLVQANYNPLEYTQKKFSPYKYKKILNWFLLNFVLVVYTNIIFRVNITCVNIGPT